MRYKAEARIITVTRSNRVSSTQFKFTIMKEVSSTISYLLYNDMYVDIFKLIDVEVMNDEWFFISRSTWDALNISTSTLIPIR